jgi:drug/metabolite transporter (DMT)-like permease
MMGAGDFFGGIATKKAPVAVVGFIGQTIGLLTVIPIILLGAQPYNQTALVIGASAGACGSVALLSLYRGLAVGRVSVVAPLSAVLGALLPVVIAMFTGHDFGTLTWIGIVAGIAAVYILSLPSVEDKAEEKQSGFLYAVTAGVALAFFYMLLGNKETHGSMWTLLGERCSVVSIMVLVLLARRQFVINKNTPSLKYITIAGVCDIVGNLAFLHSAANGPLPMVALITSLYPASTLFLGWFLLKEPLSRRLLLGIVLAFVCITLFALP